MDLKEIGKAAERMADRGTDADRALLLAAVPRLLAEIERLKKFEPAPAPQCGATCPVCDRCVACGYCECPCARLHPDDKPAAYSLPSDALNYAADDIDRRCGT